MFDIGDKVWTIRMDRPEELKVFAVIECMDLNNEISSIRFYQLVDSQAISLTVKSYGELPGKRYEASVVHATKRELLDSFL